MRTLEKLTLTVLFCSLAALAPARTVVECVDPEGNVSMRDFCPPEYTKKAEKRVQGALGPSGPSIAAAAAANPITLYTVPDCDACDLVRNALRKRNIPYTEIDVQDDAGKQEAMRAKTGNLTVPAILIGERVLSGYSRDAIDGALIEAGYPLDDASINAASPSAPVPAEAAEADGGEDFPDSDSASADIDDAEAQDALDQDDLDSGIDP